MKIENLKEAIEEAKRFLKRAEDLRKKTSKKSAYVYVYGGFPKESGSVKIVLNGYNCYLASKGYFISISKVIDNFNEIRIIGDRFQTPELKKVDKHVVWGDREINERIN